MRWHAFHKSKPPCDEQRGWAMACGLAWKSRGCRGGLPLAVGCLDHATAVLPHDDFCRDFSIIVAQIQLPTVSIRSERCNLLLVLVEQIQTACVFQSDDDNKRFLVFIQKSQNAFFPLCGKCGDWLPLFVPECKDTGI